GREVGAVPGRVTSSLAAGANALIADGAHLVADAQVVLDLLYGAGARRVPARPVPADLDPALRRLLDAVAAGHDTVATAARHADGAGDAAVALTRLELLGPQVRAVAEDIGVDAVKIGMLGDAATIAAVGEALDLLDPSTPVVLDPVMVAESGAELLEPGARDALVRKLLPRATVVTPNVPEARVIAAAPQAEPDELARAVHALGPQVVVVTGGHREDPVDVLYDGDRLEPIPGPR